MNDSSETHFELLMTELRTIRQELRDVRDELKRDGSAMASEISILQAWRNKQLGAMALVGAVAGVVGAGIVKVFALTAGVKQP